MRSTATERRDQDAPQKGPLCIFIYCGAYLSRVPHCAARAMTRAVPLVGPADFSTIRLQKVAPTWSRLETCKKIKRRAFARENFWFFQIVDGLCPNLSKSNFYVIL